MLSSDFKKGIAKLEIREMKQLNIQTILNLDMESSFSFNSILLLLVLKGKEL